MKKNKFICYDDTELQGYLFEVDNPKGVVQIAHGMQEYSKTYFKFAQFLNKKGYIVYMIDQRGHGKSCKNISFLSIGIYVSLSFLKQVIILVLSIFSKFNLLFK